MSGKKISDTKSVTQAMDVATYFSDSILTPAVKIFNSFEHWDMKNIVLSSPISLVFAVFYILSAVPTSFYFYLEERPACDANGPDWDNRNLNDYIKNNAGVILGTLVTFIALIFIIPWNCIIKPIVKSYNDFVAKDEVLDSQCLWGGDVNQLRSEVGSSLCIQPYALEELERREQDIAVNESSLFSHNSDTNENAYGAQEIELANITNVNC